ncbi:MAG: anthranilate synthase component I [candidate division Zixibacteria bacterium]|nr:anthranilate synthase component I [candidate division Zixibacteria bacterium]
MVTSFAEFEKFARQGNVLPVWEEVPADLLTPVSAFLRISKGAQFAFLLESVEGGEKLARYSFLGVHPRMIIKSRGKKIELYSDGRKKSWSGNPWRELEDIFGKYRAPKVEGLPRFWGGGVGYFGYDLVRHIEKLPGRLKDDLKQPDLWFGIYDTVLIFDHLKHKILIVRSVDLRSPKAGLDKLYANAVKAALKVKSLLAEPFRPPRSKLLKLKKREALSNTPKERFLKAVEKAQKYIVAGDVFQVVLSQRFSVPLAAHPFSVYRALRSVNPSPYLYFLKMEGLSIAGSSPEMLVRVEDGFAETRPIAGTRPRGSSEEEDARLAHELLADEKETAEHIMLVDLGRNDIGRVSEEGTVMLTDRMKIEKYSHVMHIVSGVKGKLRAGIGRFEVLASCFPAGTVSGAPKVRAMEIVDELETHRRGIYAGAVGYFDFSGNLDSCIAIRTVVCNGSRAFVQAGAGIVYDSLPEREYEETVSKAAAMFLAVERANRGEI